MKKLLFIYNPKAGKATIRTVLAQIVEIFDNAHYEVTVRPTHQSGDVTRFLAESAENFDRVVVSGGDGTLNEALCGIRKAAADGKQVPPLGFIPTGSTNDFAKTLAIPTVPLKAAEIAASGTVFPCDAGAFNEHPFTYVAAFGAFTKVSYATPQQIKNSLGHFAYIIEGIKELTNIKGIEMSVCTETETLSDRYIYGMVSNSTSVGGFDGFYSDLKVALNDGLLEVVLVKEPRSLAEQSALLADLMRMNIRSRFITVLKAKKIHFEPLSDRIPEWTLDGEFGGAPNSVTVEAIPEAYTILIPPTGE